jgi:hypothetical protein
VVKNWNVKIEYHGKIQKFSQEMQGDLSHNNGKEIYGLDQLFGNL